MRLEDLTVTLRPRTPWEAVDLGCALVRRDYGRILLLWLVSTLPVWGLLALLLWQHPGWFGLSVWWLKPLYDRLPLYHLSRAAFGAKPTLKETLREWPRLWSRFLFSALLWRRFSTIRSFALPVWMLEGQKGRAVTSRLNALATDGGGSGGALTWVFIKLEIAAYLGFLLLLGSVGQSESPSDLWDWITDPEGALEASEGFIWFSNGVYLLAISLLEPFYVGAGFGLYLNSRIRLEGWDVELAFRRLATRLRPVAEAWVAVIVALGLLFAGARSISYAQESQDGGAEKTMAQSQAEDAEKAAVQDKLKGILERSEFKEHKKTQRIWVPEASEKKQSSGSFFDPSFWRPIIVFIFVSVLVGLLVWLAVWLSRNSHAWKFHRKNRVKKLPPSGPRVVMGMDIAGDSLPEDILSAARSAWDLGQLREALSLLYRGALSRLVEYQHLPIRDSDTEEDCLEKVAALGDVSVTEFFRSLTFVWVRAAYAGVEAQQAEFAALCDRWPFAAHVRGQAGRAGRKVFARASLLAIVLLPWLCGCKGEWQDRELELGYKGEARIDPFLAACWLLEEEGIAARRSLTWNDLPGSYGSTVFASGEGGMSEGRAQTVMLWVNRGGHLVYCLGGCGPYNDWNPFAESAAFGHAVNEDTDPILRTMGVTRGKSKPHDPKDSSKDEQSGKGDKEGSETPAAAEDKKMTVTRLIKVELKGRSFEAEFPAGYGFEYDQPLGSYDFAASSDGQIHLLSLEHGLGRITFVSHARPFRNRYLDENDHAPLLVALLSDGDEARFIVGLQDSFLAFLWDRAWQPIMGLGVLTLVWLWVNMPRFGPMRQVNLHQTRRFMEHVKSLGFFFYRLKRPDLLLGAAADAVRVRALRRHPYLAGLDDSALVELLLERSDLPAERIRAALETSGRPASHDLVRRMQDLQTLRLSLD